MCPLVTTVCCALCHTCNCMYNLCLNFLKGTAKGFSVADVTDEALEIRVRPQSHAYSLVWYFYFVLF